MRLGSRMIAEPDIPKSNKPVIPDSDRESSDIACEWIPAFAGMTNVNNGSIDAVGNVLAIYNANSTGRGNELYTFTQDAFGNELTTSPFSGTAWSTARTAGITEHQTGKWIDPFTGLYFFHARWYDCGVGRFVGRDPLKPILPFESILQASCTNCRFPEKTKRPFLENPGLFSLYGFCQQNPVIQTDPDGQGIIAILLLANQIINCALCVWDIYLVAQCLSDRAELAEQIHNSSLPNEKQDELLKGIFNDCFSLIESDVLQSAGKCFVATLTRYLGWMTKDMLPPSLQEYF